MVLTMIKNKQSIKDACRQVEALAQNIVVLAKNAGFHYSYGGWVGDIMSDSRDEHLLHSSNTLPIGLVWPYRNRLRYSYCDDQICLAVQVAMILEIGDSLDAGAEASGPEYAHLSLLHTVMEAQISARQIIQQLVDARADGVDTGANLYRLGWFRKWAFLINQADD